MRTLTETEARGQLHDLLDQVAVTHEPVTIVGKRVRAVLIAEEDWRSIQDTMYLLDMPGMRESIVEGLKAPVEEYSDEVDW